LRHIYKRQANKAILGYLYQFHKSLLEVLVAEDDAYVTIEGKIEDIDIVSADGSETTIQCKYHEEQKFKMSSIAIPLLEMMSHFTERRVSGYRDIKYILYAYFENNVNSINQSTFNDFLQKTKNEDIIVTYFPLIYKITDKGILTLLNNPTNMNNRLRIKEFFTSKSKELKYKVNLSDFFDCFEYHKAERYEDLVRKVKSELCKSKDAQTVESLYYPNAITRVVNLSSLSDPKARRIRKRDLWEWLEVQRALLLNYWILEINGRDKVLREKKEYLISMFSNNTDVRVFIFTEAFLARNKDKLVPFIKEYVQKYYKKRKLQSPPIFIFKSDNTFVNRVVAELYKYHIYVNNGLVGGEFILGSFISNDNCSADFSAKVTITSVNLVEILQKCGTDYLFYIGNCADALIDPGFKTEILGISTIEELSYLVNLNRKC
jgi:hypothetical protein